MSVLRPSASSAPRTGFALLVIPFALVILAACGGTGEDSNSLRATSQPDFETCAGFLDLAQVKDAAGRGDVILADPNPNSGAGDDPFTAMCIIGFVTPDILGDSGDSLLVGPSMNLVVMEFATSDDAASFHEPIASEIRSMRDAVLPEAELVEGEMGPGSYAVTLDYEGIGSVLGFRQDTYIVSFNTTAPDGAEPFMTTGAIETLALQVRANLIAR